MPSGINSYVFCADYSDIAACLFAIQAIDDGGGFTGDAETRALLDALSLDVLKKLYNRSIWILGKLQGVQITIDGQALGDFDGVDFSAIDFNVGFLDGEFEYWDFSGYDFNVGMIDLRNQGYSSMFQTVLNIFALFCRYNPGLSAADAQSLVTAFVPVLSVIKQLRARLTEVGLNPCDSVPASFNNASQLYLQAVGSEGADGIARGIHLRWGFAGDLGLNHLPQGDYYNGSGSPTGYNKTDDYVVLYRTPYSNPSVFTIDFGSAQPAIDYDSKTWSYILNDTSVTPKITNQFNLVFADAQLYNQAAQLVDPQQDPFSFLKAYNGVIAISIDSKYAFAVGYDFRLKEGQSTGQLKIQGTSPDNTNGSSGEIINFRKTITGDAAGPVSATIFGENISKIEIQQTAGGFLQSLSFQTYDDFAATRTLSDWTVLGGQFALSLYDAVVLDRLENAQYPIDNLWPQYRNRTRVKVANYVDKWSVDRTNDPGMKSTIARYLTLAQTDPRAVGIVKDETMPDAPQMSISYLDVLNFTALDYHWARMMGLGHIDTGINAGSDTDRYVYKISYVNRKSADSAELVTYEYLSLPTGLADSRLPEQPPIRPVSYTMPGNNVLASLYDSNGYGLHNAVRLVSIGRQLYAHEQTGNAFFNDSAITINFNIFENTKSIFYGIEYRPDTQVNYVKPEIATTLGPGFPYYAYDDDFPTTGLLEMVPLADNPLSLFTHFEGDTGVHDYAIFGIDWFSRASALSSEVKTDDTEFALNNSLTPPSNLAVQYIQPEDPLVFTTQREQDWLSGRTAQFPNGDVGFTRVTFDWIDMVDLSNVKNIATFDFSKLVKATRLKPWFKPHPLIQISGIILKVIPVSQNDNLLQLFTTDYVMLDGTHISPTVASGDLGKFAGSLLTTEQGQFRVDSVTNAGGLALFTVEKIKQVLTVNDPSTPNLFGTRNTYISPSVGSRFTATENLTQTASWLPVAEEIQLVDFVDPANRVIETSVDDQGHTIRYLVGGLYGEAIITQLYDVNTGEIMLGYYSVTFTPDKSLPALPQTNLPFDPSNPSGNTPDILQTPYVEWYNGQVRMPLAAGGNDDSKKIVSVISITQASPLQLYVYDAGYADEPVQVSADSNDWISGINFHPGYRAYLYAEPAPDHAFNGGNILPGPTERDKRTMLGLQATDLGTDRSGFTSRVSAPAILLAAKIILPVQLPPPVTYGLRVRPDATTKAAFTFDSAILPNAAGNARTPFGFMFYRISNEDVLEALYAPATVAAIVAALSSLTTDEHFNQRYYELVNLIYDPAHDGQFKVFDAVPNPYGFPLPDKAGLIDPVHDVTQAQKTAKYSSAILGSIMPVTAQPPLFSLLKTGLQTENKLPKLRTVDGNLLDPSDPAFDPFPMVRKYTQSSVPDTSYVRVTDYSLNGFSRYLYFYSSAEVSDKLVVGPLSLFAGPVLIVHSLPAAAPIVRSFTLGPPATGSTSPVAITFFLSPFASDDPITKVRVYRTYVQNHADSLQTMDMQADIPVVTDTDTGIVTVDDFSDLPAIPYGEVIYYRLAFIRTIVNEREEQEDVVGLGSEVVTVTLIDTVNPPPPALTYTAGSNELSWPVTANKGTYYLYQQNDRGNWQRIYGVTPPATATTVNYPLPAPLVLTDADGKRIYYRFKVQAQNASGLLNLTDNELTI